MSSSKPIGRDRRFRILSDFDGVWTNQAFEARQVKLYLAAEAARLAGVAADDAIQHFERFEREVKSQPHNFGWAPDGRITAYVDEDPLCEANAIAEYISIRKDDREASLYHSAIITAGFSNIASFSDYCFLNATARFRAEHPPALVSTAREAVERLYECGAEIVIVSNSPSEKILGWFSGAGLSPDDTHRFRVRGLAGKQFLGESGAEIQVGGRRIAIDRPRYKTILEEERPDLIVGDVFSLDLALPHVLRRDGRSGAPQMLVLRKHPHTPRWILDTLAGGAIDAVIDDVAELPPLVKSLH